MNEKCKVSASEYYCPFDSLTMTHPFLQFMISVISQLVFVLSVLPELWQVLH